MLSCSLASHEIQTAARDGAFSGVNQVIQLQRIHKFLETSERRQRCHFFETDINAVAWRELAISSFNADLLREPIAGLGGTVLAGASA